MLIRFAIHIKKISYNSIAPEIPNRQQRQYRWKLINIMEPIKEVAMQTIKMKGGTLI